MAKVLITGLHGYISGAVKRRFEQAGMEAELIDVRGEGWENTSFAGAETLIHCAALVHKNEKQHPLEEYRQVNTVLTARLAEKAKREGVKQFIFLSTIAVYGVKISCFRSVCVDETTPTKPITKYGITKLEAEEALHALEDDSFRVAILRPPFVYGPNCRGNYGVLRSLTLKIGIIPKLPNRKSIIYVENLAEAVFGIARRQLSGTFCVQNREVVSTWQIAQRIAQCCGKPVLLTKVINLPVQLASLGIAKFRTAFGSEYYSDSSANCCGFDYNVVSFADSIEKTEKDWKS